MDIFLSVGRANEHAIILTLDPENISGTCTGDMAYLRVQAYMKRTDAWFEPPLRGSLPLLLELHGFLGSGFSAPTSGASLAPLDDLPIDLTTEKSYEQHVNLAFGCSRRFIQDLEVERARNGSRRMLFELHLWGTVALVTPRHDQLETAETVPIETPTFRMPRDTRIEVVGLKSVRLRNHNERLQVSLSHWEDMLPNLGYPRRAIYELPTLDASKLPEELRAAADHVNTAHQFFLQEDYGAAVQQCRQARDALLVPNKKAWCQEHLSEVMGVEKATMVDEAIQALNHLGHPASHGASGVEIDRDAAEYVVGTMTLILHYIERKLR